MKHSLHVIIFSVATTLMLSTYTLQAQERMVISQVEAPPSAYRLMAERVLQEAYARLGIGLEFKLLPAERALVYANDGTTDGEFARIAGLEERYPNLLVVPVPIAYEDIVIFSQNVTLTVDGWQSLVPYTINFIQGFKLAEIRTQGMQVEMVTTVEQAFKKLDAGRTDVVVDLRSSACLITQLGFSDIAILEPSLEQLVQYHYVHKRHQPLAEKLKTVLTQMQKDGTLQAIQNKAIEDFLTCQ